MQLIGRLRALAAAPSRRHLFWSSLLHGRSPVQVRTGHHLACYFYPPCLLPSHLLKTDSASLQTKKNVFNLKPVSKLKYGVLFCFLSASAPASHACGDCNWIAGVSQDKSVLLPSQSFLEPGHGFCMMASSLIGKAEVSSGQCQEV